MSDVDELVKALAAVQAELPQIHKTETAQTGSYSYRYADLAAVSRAVLPLLGRHGLAWITRPTVREDGRLVLAYELRHVSGQSISGEYPLPSPTSAPQQLGSAITYARRYCLCSVTGVAPDSDDDDAAAASRRPTGRDEWEHAQPRQQRQRQPGREEIIARARQAIADAPDQARLDEIESLIRQRESEGAITADDAIELRRLRVARLDELFPAGEQQAIESAEEWPETAEVPA